MRKIKEKRMQSYVLRARKMVQEGKNKEGAVWTTRINVKSMS